MRPSPVLWTGAELARLRVLWAEGLPVSAIGRKMGRGKNSIVGKAHRLDLDPRPSPVFRNGERQPLKPRVLRPHTSTLPALASAVKAPTTRSPIPVLPGAGQQVVVPSPPSPVVVLLSREGCQYPTSAGRPWTFCGGLCRMGDVYCAPHKRGCYVRVAA